VPTVRLEHHHPGARGVGDREEGRGVAGFYLAADDDCVIAGLDTGGARWADQDEDRGEPGDVAVRAAYDEMVRTEKGEE